MIVAVAGTLALLREPPDEDTGLGPGVIASEDALPESIIDEQDLARTEPGEPEHEFLRYWRSLQFQDWASALALMDPGLVDAIGRERLINAFQSQTSFYTAEKPQIVAKESGASPGSVRYVVEDSAGVIVAFATSWRRIGTDWRLAFDSYLDGALRSSVQISRQNEIDPSATTPAPEAIRAGELAAQVQAKRLARLLEAEGD